jgi:hypothetical protein
MCVLLVLLRRLLHTLGRQHSHARPEAWTSDLFFRTQPPSHGRIPFCSIDTPATLRWNPPPALRAHSPRAVTANHRLGALHPCCS